jgi:hypothetical protein
MDDPLMWPALVAATYALEDNAAIFPQLIGGSGRKDREALVRGLMFLDERGHATPHLLRLLSQYCGAYDNWGTLDSGTDAGVDDFFGRLFSPCSQLPSETSLSTTFPESQERTLIHDACVVYSELDPVSARAEAELWDTVWTSLVPVRSNSDRRGHYPGSLYRDNIVKDNKCQ